jgi:hypothetical protein
MTLTADKSSCAIISRETDVWGILRGATPRWANNCASIADTTSSNGPRPATHATSPVAVPWIRS